MCQLLSHVCINEKQIVVMHCIFHPSKLHDSCTWMLFHMILPIVSSCGCECWPWRGFVPSRCLAHSMAALLWMGRSLSSMLMRQEEERGEASCCSARQGFHIVLTVNCCTGSRSDETTAALEEVRNSTRPKGLKHYPVNGPHLTSMACPL